MPAVQVRDLDKTTYDRLSESARANRRSIAQETRVALEAYLDDGAVAGRDEDVQVRSRRRKAVLAQVRAEGEVRLPDGVPFPEDLVRQDRDAR